MKYDAVIIPGGGLEDAGNLHPWCEARFDAAMAAQADGPFLCLSGGSPHKITPRDAHGRPLFEAYAGAAYLLKRGVPSSRIFTEISSYDTIGNAFFARVQHTDVRGWRRLVIVNSAFHMSRTRAIFDWMFGLAPAHGYELTYVEAPDDSMPAALRARRAEREELNTRRFLTEVAPRFQDLAAVHAWLYADHGAYQAESVLSRPAPEPAISSLY